MLKIALEEIEHASLDIVRVISFRFSLQDVSESTLLESSMSEVPGSLEWR
jgi:hypothetical protein